MLHRRTPNFTVNVCRETNAGGLRGYEMDVEHCRFNGDGLVRLRSTVMMSTDAAGALPYDPIRGSVLLVEQLRLGTLLASRKAAGLEPYTLEIPAGIVEAGEDPVQVAARELFEETGCRARKVEFVARYLADPVQSANIFSLFAMEVDAGEHRELAGMEQGEDLRVRELSRADFLEMLDGHALQDAATIIAAQWLRAHRT
ncbi:MAG TPA: NUDIX hydrolase [Thermoanaerobaculia bacterium]|jgi:ADP-ribose pyrophosphatase|nr:NUDIX hydrolase [Thermoanaerobaculia bacterium]